jgi:hypothetical protein
MTDDELARMRRDAESLAAARAAMVGNGQYTEVGPWRAEYFHNRSGPEYSFWEVTNDAPDGSDRYGVFDSASEEAVRFVVSARNLTPEADVLALLAEVERLRAENLGLRNGHEWAARAAHIRPSGPVIAPF